MRESRKPNDTAMTEAELRAIRERHAEVVAWEQAEPPIDPPRNMTWPDCHEDRGSLLAALDAERDLADRLAERFNDAALAYHEYAHKGDQRHCQERACLEDLAALAAYRAARGAE